jgi:hypothetical protein
VNKKNHCWTISINRNCFSSVHRLFGSEDVDLRTMPKAGAEVLTAPPPPMISQSDLNKPSTVSMKIKDRKSRFEEVRAKLAEATKTRKDKLGRPLLYIKLPDDPLERRRRISTPSKQEPPKREKVTADDENSQESYTTNMKTIITQAQEQLDSKEIDKDQYETLVKQVLQINEKRQIAEMQRKMQEEEGAGSSGPEERVKNGDGRAGQRRKHDYDERAGGKGKRIIKLKFAELKYVFLIFKKNLSMAYLLSLG